MIAPLERGGSDHEWNANQRPQGPLSSRIRERRVFCFPWETKYPALSEFAGSAGLLRPQPDQFSLFKRKLSRPPLSGTAVWPRPTQSNKKTENNKSLKRFFLLRNCSGQDSFYYVNESSTHACSA